MPFNSSRHSPTLRWTRRAAVLALGVAATLGSHAQSKPPVRILVGFAAGGGVDTIARLLAESMASTLGQSVVVENRPGAGGMLAAQALKSAVPDGNTLLLTNDHTVAILPHTLKTPGYSTERDFAPVALVSDKGVMGLATHNGTGIQALKDIPEWARQNPGKSNFGVPAPGSMPEFAVGLLGKSLKVDGTAVPYKGGAPMVLDLAAGQIPFGITSTAELYPFVKDQKMRILAVTGPARLPDLPNVPTFAELGVKGMEMANVVGLYAPAGTPAAVITRYTEAVRVAVASAKIQERMLALGVPANFGGPEAMAKSIQSISDSWGPVIKQSGYQPQ